MKTAFYFGCSNDHMGHFLYDPSGRSGLTARQEDFPVAEHVLDGGLLPPWRPQVEGRATLVHINGWTILSFWDRSIDARGNSSSSFLVKGKLSFDEICARAKYHFAAIWARFAFPIVEAP